MRLSVPQHIRYNLFPNTRPKILCEILWDTFITILNAHVLSHIMWQSKKHRVKVQGQLNISFPPIPPSNVGFSCKPNHLQHKFVSQHCVRSAGSIDA